MSWLFSQALVEEYLGENSLDGEQCAQLNVMPTQHKFWRNDKTMEFSDLSRFGLTCNLLTESRGEELLTLYLEGFPVRTLARLGGGAQGSMESDQDYGQKWPGSFVKYNQSGCFWKTAQCSLLEGSGEFLGTWPKWGLMRNGECWELDMSGALTCEKESGLWHPTPTKSDYRGANLRGEKQRESQLKEWLHVRYSQGMKTTYPHPSFLERVMAWPQGWTELQPLEMDKFQSWLQQHGES